jgi:hypothetical protein
VLSQWSLSAPIHPYYDSFLHSNRFIISDKSPSGWNTQQGLNIYQFKKEQWSTVMSRHDQINLLVEWLSTFDPNHLKNEDDVETKFVLPFLRYLGYTDTYRKGKFPIDDYQPGKGRRGRKPEIDQIYFSVDEDDKQGADTSLLLVEAKEPQERNLEEAIKQAKYYGNHLAPLFLVITNGYHLIILKRHHYRGEEVVFDNPTHMLLDRTMAEELYKQLQFDLIKQLKERGIDTLTHDLYTKLMNASHRYPDLHAQLTKGDFEPSIVQEKRRLTVIKPTVAIKCDLPVVFEEGSCTIEFSNIMLRGLTCHLSHNEILSTLFVGMGTSPDWKTRCFLDREKDVFKIFLGNTTVILSEREAYELCEVVDEVCQKYKDLMIEATNILETWNFTPVTIDNTQGFHLISVKRWLWNLMIQFTSEFDYDKGNSAWHIFDSKSSMIRVSPKSISDDHVIILSKAKTTYFPSSLSNDDIDLVYTDSITYLSLYDDASREYVYEDVGPQGVWTAKYTREWMLQKFIPTVLSYYLGPQSSTDKEDRKIVEKLPPDILSYYKKRNRKAMTVEQISSIMQEAVDDCFYEQKTPLAEANNPKDFELYINEIQALFYHYFVKNIPTSILRPYYRELAKVARYVDSTTINTGYIREKLQSVQNRRKRRGTYYEESENKELLTYNSILDYLDQQVIQVYETNFEDHKIVDLLSRVFGTLVEEGVFNIPQSQINAAKQALLPIWNLCHFEMRFIEPIVLGYQEKL